MGNSFAANMGSHITDGKVRVGIFYKSNRSDSHTYRVRHSQTLKARQNTILPYLDNYLNQTYSIYGLCGKMNIFSSTESHLMRYSLTELSGETGLYSILAPRCQNQSNQL